MVEMCRRQESQTLCLVFFCTDPCKGNMPLRRRTGRAASSGEGHFPTRLQILTVFKYRSGILYNSVIFQSGGGDFSGLR